MAATTGLGDASTAWMTACKEGSAVICGVPNSRMSAPAEKLFPAPARTTALTPGSAAARSRPSTIPRRSAWPRPLTGGLFKVITATAPRVEYSAGPMLPAILGPERGPRQWSWSSSQDGGLRSPLTPKRRVVVSWPLAQAKASLDGGRGPFSRRSRAPLPRQGVRGDDRARDRQGGAHAARQPALPLPDEGQPAARPHEARGGRGPGRHPRRHPRGARPGGAAASGPPGPAALPALAARLPGRALRMAVPQGRGAGGDDPIARPVRGLLVRPPLRGGGDRAAAPGHRPAAPPLPALRRDQRRRPLVPRRRAAHSRRDQRRLLGLHRLRRGRRGAPARRHRLRAPHAVRPRDGRRRSAGAVVTRRRIETEASDAYKSDRSRARPRARRALRGARAV